ncbi:hypothetical protein M405DRAFT_831099 [Rhizopogon salebrosus TDB-379]|nr:hypothetical protein M405DRAFT_831099 [Rhizopogon salebrosus TDB-379]
MKDAERSKFALNVNNMMSRKGTAAWVATPVAMAAKGQASPRIWRPTHSDSCFAWTRITLGSSIKTTG